MRASSTITAISPAAKTSNNCSSVETQYVINSAPTASPSRSARTRLSLHNTICMVCLRVRCFTHVTSYNEKGGRLRHRPPPTALVLALEVAFLLDIGAGIQLGRDWLSLKPNRFIHGAHR